MLSHACEGSDFNSQLNEDELCQKFLDYWSRYVNIYCGPDPEDVPVLFFENDNAENEFREIVTVHQYTQKIMKLIKDETQDYTDRISEFCDILGIQLSDLAKERLFRRIHILGMFGMTDKVFKYVINHIFADYFGTDFPEIPWLTVKFFPRKLYVHINRMGRSRKTKCLVDLYSLFQGLKKAMVPIRPDRIDDTLLAHAKALKRDMGNLNHSDELFFLNILEEKFASVQYKRKFIPRDNQISKGNISMNATVQYPRSAGGQVGYGIDSLACDCSYSDDAVKSGHSREFSDLMEKLSEPETLRCFAELETRTTRYGVLVKRERLIVPCYSRLPENKDILEKIRLADFWNDNVVQPAVILEPLKGRIITKPSLGAYLGMNPIQKHFWSKLKKIREFSLIGRPVEEVDVAWMATSWKEGYKFNSGDYSGATDNLKSALSKLILRFLLPNMSLDDYLHIENSFCNATIDYSKPPIRSKDSPWGELYRNWRSVNLGSIEQRNGQLMGHVLSFPILCISNYLLFRLAHQKYNEFRQDEVLYRDPLDWSSQDFAYNPADFEFEEIPNVLVNGDDILFACSPGFYGIWNEQVKDYGFYPSLGKNLYSSEICQINSELFKMPFRKVPNRVVPEKLDERFFRVSDKERQKYPSAGSHLVQYGEEEVWLGDVDEADRFKTIPAPPVRIPYLSMGLICGRGKGKTFIDGEEQLCFRVSIDKAMRECDNLVKELPSYQSNMEILASIPSYKEKSQELFMLKRPILLSLCAKLSLDDSYPMNWFGKLVESPGLEAYKSWAEMLASRGRETILKEWEGMIRALRVPKGYCLPDPFTKVIEFCKLL